ncbi:MAG: hypothetical protein R3253_00265 [Longimicrobiales bacterium]|nr:hypothetical protein [Longimicrobiales bacterium]
MKKNPDQPHPDSQPTSSLTRVVGVFKDRKRLVRAVETLAEKSVPADAIRVVVDDGSGGIREIPVEDESGALKGAVIGAAAGGVLGLGIVVAVATGVYGTPDVGVLSFRGVSGALRAILGGAAAAVPLGALLGLGYWQGRKKIAPEDFDSGSARVVVRSDELAELARRVMGDAGATDVTTEP